MYLVSIYFDEKADKRIREYIRLAAKRSGNLFMLEGNVPPHITVSAFELRETAEIKVVGALEKSVKNLHRGTLQWICTGAFFPGVLFIAPVLNAYLQKLAEQIYDCLSGMDGVEISRFYRPYQWQPHTTVAKQLNREQMGDAFGVLQESFGMFGGEVIRIGLAKTNPYEDIISWDVW